MSRQGVVFLLVAAGPLLSQQQPASKPAPPVEMTAQLTDGSVIRGVILQQSVELTTKHGKLTIPVADIRRIEIGLRLSKEEAAEIDRLIARLGSDKAAERDEAGKKLTALGHRAYSPLKTAAASKDKQVAAQAAAALEQIRATSAAELLRPHDHDVIHTSDSILSGRIKETVLRAKTASFGEMQFKLADLVSLRTSPASTIITVGAGTFSPGVRWHDTGILVAAEMGVVIRASGEIDLQADNGGIRVVSGPGGCLTVPGPVHFPGTLVGKIGDQKGYFVIGDGFEGKFAKGGKLFLWVVPWENGAKTIGCYRVNVALGRDLALEAATLEEKKREPQQLEAIEAKRKKRHQFSKEVAAWTEQMRSPQFNANDRDRYEKGISRNLRDIQRLEKEMRDDIGLHPAEWLEMVAPKVVPWNGGGMFR